MPSYARAGELPPKRHTQFRRPDGGLYAEELFSTRGFDSVYALLYHLRPPTAMLEVGPWERPRP
ncbi:MAG: homogentisate 1,2-dioxygenase, partial [Vulcanimicrobiaceae bacterium]